MASQSTIRDVRDFARICLNANVPKKTIAPLLVAVGRMDELVGELEATLAKTESYDAIAADLASGKVTVKETAITLAERNMIRAAQVRDIVQEAQVMCYRDAVAFIRQDPDAIAATGPGPRGWLTEFGFVAPAPPEPLTEEEEYAARQHMAARGNPSTNW